MSSKKEVIPVTSLIRDYLKEMEVSDEEKDRFSSIVSEGHYLKKERFKYIITNDKDNKTNIDDKISFYNNIATKLDKSLVWVYQELVLNGYGEYIDHNSDIYKASLLAYSDISYFIEKNDIEGLKFYEKYCILDKNIYGDCVISKKCKKLIKR